MGVPAFDPTGVTPCGWMGLNPADPDCDPGGGGGAAPLVGVDAPLSFPLEEEEGVGRKAMGRITALP